MGKGKKKGGSGKISKEVEDLESLTISDAPSTSEPMQAEEEEEGLTGAAKRRKKKELKKAEKEAKKGDSAEVKDVPLEEAPSLTEPSTSVTEPSPAPTVVEPSKPKEAPKQEEEEEGGLGLVMGGSRKKQRKKKGDAAKAAASQGPSLTDVNPVKEVPPTSGAQPAPVEAPRDAPKSRWGRDQTSPQDSTPMDLASPAKGASTPWSRLPAAVGQSRSSATSPGSEMSLPSSSRSSTTSSKIEMTAVPEREQSYHARTPVTCRFKIPKKIEGNSVRTMPVKVLTNYLPMTIKTLKIFRYDISFKPDRPKKMLGKVFTLSKEKHFPQNLTAFDQIKNCYSLTELKGVTAAERYTTHVDITDQNGRVINFEVSYKATGIVDLGSITNYMNTGGTSLSPPTEAIQCIDVILRQGTLESYVKAGRQFFKRPANPIDLGDGLEMWTGLFQSGIFTSRAFINIDVAHKGFPRQQPLVNALQDFRLDPRKALEFQRGRGLENFQSYLKGLRVVAAIGGDSSSKGMKREFICNGFVGPADKETFCYESPDGKKQHMTVTQYFLQVKNVRLKYPALNCIWVGPREKTIFYPMELLEVGYGQAQNKQLNETQLATMVRQAATPPDERKRKIEEVIQNMNYSRNQYFKKFGLEISDQFFQVDAKILKPPDLEVGEPRPPMMKRGVWQSNKVYKPETLQSWGFISVEADPNRCDFENTIKMIQKIGRSMGMVVTDPIIKKFDVNIRTLQSVLFTALEKNVKFLFVVVSSKGRDYYHRVKQMAERDVGILTQCIKEFTAASRMNLQTVKNILLKVNAKLMGINQVLSQSCLPRCLQSGGVMVVGADVTHPSPDQSNIPSIAAVTASIDTKFFLYNIELSIQTPKKEMIVEFEDMMVEHLKVYRNHQKSLPRKIFVFRDGVSEGQFAHVMNSELQAVHNAYKTLGGPQSRPEVLFLLVQKRHHTRLFVPNSPQNVEPGTVVDKHIVHASELDFYLVSHQAIKGTARPTRYHAVCNDGGIPHDEVEQLTYYLCHLYARCMRAVSYPTPTYYAHLACLRARSLTYGEKFDNKELERHPKRLRVMEKILQYSRMFFV